MITAFTVYGTPVPKGSARSFACRRKVNGAWVYTGKTVTQQSNEKDLRPYEAKVRDAAKEAGAQVTSLPVLVVMRFYFRRPKCHYRTGANQHLVKPAAPANHTAKPDIDKLVRSILDGLTGVAFVDDSQVVQVVAQKRWNDFRDAEERVHVEVEAL
jgi:Holliday junction resolvase RusA-like endonuclease